MERERFSSYVAANLLCSFKKLWINSKRTVTPREKPHSLRTQNMYVCGRNLVVLMLLYENERSFLCMHAILVCVYVYACMFALTSNKAEHKFLF